MIEELKDKDGLLHTKHMELINGRIEVKGCEVFVSPTASRVAEYVFQDAKLWNTARFLVSLKDIIRGRAPVFGVPFERGLQEITNQKRGVVKSIYQRPDWQYLQGHAVVGSLLTHITYSEEVITFEAWQFLDVDGETFYMHGQIDGSRGIFLHLDGAIMYHAPEEKEQVIAHGRKIKGQRYEKHFRLDGEISMSNAVEIMRLYLPLVDLTEEFLETIEKNAVTE